MTELKEQQQSSTVLQRKKSDIIEKYGERDNFLLVFNPSKQYDYCKDVTRCHFGAAPTLATLNNVYGSNTASMWLIPQLFNLSEYCGCKDKLTDFQLEELANVIAMNFYYLKVTELMLFFIRFKSGRYGRFYGNIDPLVITTSLNDFIKERNDAISEREKIDSMKRIEKLSEGAVSYEQYKEMLNKHEIIKSDER